MNFKLVYTKRAVKDIQNLDNNVRKRIGKALIRYREDPMKKAEKLTDFAFGTYKFKYAARERLNPLCHII